MNIHLTVQNLDTGICDEVELSVPVSGILLGRKSSDLQLNDRYCSAKHALLYVSAIGELWLKDLGSSNGILVNDTKENAVRIDEGDKIIIGHTQIWIRAIEPQTSGTSATASEVVHTWPELTECQSAKPSRQLGQEVREAPKR